MNSTSSDDTQTEMGTLAVVTAVAAAGLFGLGIGALIGAKLERRRALQAIQADYEDTRGWYRDTAAAGLYDDPERPFMRAKALTLFGLLDTELKSRPSNNLPAPWDLVTT